jgi:hypothetical protein
MQLNVSALSIISSYNHSFFFHSLYIPHHTTSHPISPHPTTLHLISPHLTPSYLTLPYHTLPHLTPPTLAPSYLRSGKNTIGYEDMVAYAEETGETRAKTSLQIDCALTFAAVSLDWLSSVMLTVCLCSWTCVRKCLIVCAYLCMCVSVCASVCVCVTDQSHPSSCRLAPYLYLHLSMSSPISLPLFLLFLHCLYRRFNCNTRCRACFRNLRYRWRWGDRATGLHPLRCQTESYPSGTRTLRHCYDVKRSHVTLQYMLHCQHSHRGWSQQANLLFARLLYYVQRLTLQHVVTLLRDSTRSARIPNITNYSLLISHLILSSLTTHHS